MTSVGKCHKPEKKQVAIHRISTTKMAAPHDVSLVLSLPSPFAVPFLYHLCMGFRLRLNRLLLPATFGWPVSCCVVPSHRQLRKHALCASVDGASPKRQPSTRSISPCRLLLSRHCFIYTIYLSFIFYDWIVVLSESARWP